LYLAQDAFPVLAAHLLLVQLHLPFDVPIQDHVLKDQLVLGEHSLLKIWKFLFVFLFQRVEIVHELESFEVEGGGLFVLLQKDLFLIFEELVLDYVLLDQQVERFYVFAGERDFEVGLVSFRLFLA
jgi:hypothetical protein